MIEIKEFMTEDELGYLEKVILLSIGILNSISLTDIRRLKTIAIKYTSEVLSEVSLLNSVLSLMINNTVNLNKNINLSDEVRSLYSMSDTSSKSLSVKEMNYITELFAEKLNSLKAKVSDQLDINSDALSIYSTSSSEAGIDYGYLKRNNSVVLNYFEGKVALSKIASLMKDFSSKKDRMDDILLSSTNLYVGKFYEMLMSYSRKIQGRLIFIDQLEELVDACKVGGLIHSEYSLTDQHSLDLFLGRKYSRIKEDIIKAIKNNI